MWSPGGYVATGVAEAETGFVVPERIPQKTHRGFLVSKYKNTLLWIKMYIVENFSMHSQGHVWKRSFSRVCLMLPVCSLSWVHES